MEKKRKVIKLLEKQEEALFSKAPNIGFGGAWGSGKTLVLCLWIKFKSEVENNLILVGRKTYDELRDTTQRDFFDIFPEYKQYHNKNENATYLPNKSTILWRHLDEWHKLTNLNLGAFAIDQAEEIAEECFIALQGRLRRQVEGRQSFVVFNTEGHNWIWKRFKKTPHKNYHLIETTTFDNPHLPDDYFQRLKQLPKNVTKRYVFGSWAVFEGQVWEDFDESRHKVMPFQIPEQWDKIVALDHGVTNPTGVLWGAVDFDGKVYIYDEYYKAGEIISYHAEQIKRRNNGKVKDWLIDPACTAKINSKNGQLYSVIDEYRDQGLYFRPADNHVLAGINRVAEYFKQDKLFIFSNCINLIEEINQYKWQKLKPGEEKNQPDKPVKHKDHLCDCTRYMLMSRKGATEKIERPAPKGSVADLMEQERIDAEDWRKAYA